MTGQAASDRATGEQRLARRWLANLVFGDPLPDDRREQILEHAYSGELEKAHPAEWQRAFGMARDQLAASGPRHGDIPADAARLMTPIVGVVEEAGEGRQ